MDESAVVITRQFDAPREVLFKAWTDAEQLTHWFGPTHFTNHSVEVDPRPGGAFKIVMQSPDGVDYPTGGRFLEVVEPERLVFTEDTTANSPEFPAMLRGMLAEAGADPDASVDSVVTVTFEERDGGTLLSIHSQFANPDVRAAFEKMQMEAGWNESLDTLTNLVAGD